MERNFLTLFAFLIFAFFFLMKSKAVAGERSLEPVTLPNYPSNWAFGPTYGLDENLCKRDEGKLFLIPPSEKTTCAPITNG